MKSLNQLPEFGHMLTDQKSGCLAVSKLQFITVFFATARSPSASFSKGYQSFAPLRPMADGG